MGGGSGWSVEMPERDLAQNRLEVAHCGEMLGGAPGDEAGAVGALGNSVKISALCEWLAGDLLRAVGC